jgi:phosphate starvation-inducible PhoH-like protein
MSKRKTKPLSDFDSFTDIHIKSFFLEFKNASQKMAWSLYDRHDVLFMLGPPGVGKTHLAMAFAIHDLLERKRNKIILSRPIVEAGENLGYLPGTLQEKVDPYMTPLFDCMERLFSQINSNASKDYIMRNYEVAPLAYLRGRNFSHTVCILDEAQNCTKAQIKLFLTRMSENCKMIVSADPDQSDLGRDNCISDVVGMLESVKGIATVRFGEDAIVRHPLVSKILKCLK